MPGCVAEAICPLHGGLGGQVAHRVAGPLLLDSPLRSELEPRLSAGAFSFCDPTRR
jgi:hypothetical protein